MAKGIDEKMNVCVIGLGTIGLPTAMYLSKYHNVIGYDIDSSKVETVKHHIFATTEWSEIPLSDVYVICVNTWWRGFPDMSAVVDVSNKIATKSNGKTLVLIESTVSLGTCRRIYENIFKKQGYVANCPHRLWELGKLSNATVEEMENYGINQLRVLGAVNEESLQVGKDFFQSINISVHPASSIEASEMSKLAENAYRYVEIAYAEELALTCKNQGLNFNEIRKLCNTIERKWGKEEWHVQIMEARDGIGGTCLPKDTMFLSSTKGPKHLILGAVKIDQVYKEEYRQQTGV